MKRTLLFVLLDDFADWEAAYLAPALRGGVLPGHEGSYDTCYAAPGGRPVRSIGGMTVHPDRDLSALPFSDAASRENAAEALALFDVLGIDTAPSARRAREACSSARSATPAPFWRRTAN
jgi:hypothetical protein